MLGRWQADSYVLVRRVVIILTVLNLINYLDRFMLSALMPAIQSDLRLTDIQVGLLGSVFIYAYPFASLLFGWLGDQWSKPKLMAVGVGLWSLATAATGLASTFFTQSLSRIAVGAGESAFSSISPAVMAEVVAPEQRARTFAWYSGAIPVGSALGFLLAGILEPWIGWRHSFFVVGIPGLFLTILLWHLGSHIKTKPSEEDIPPFLKTMGRLLTNGGYLFTILGYTAHTFVVGALAHWLPIYVIRVYDVSAAEANLKVGALSVVGGVIGTLIGGSLADRWQKENGNGYMSLCIFSVILAAPMMAWTLSLREFIWFLPILFLLECVLFLPFSPLDSAVVSFVSPKVRAFASAMTIFVIHVFGDGISRTLIGALSENHGIHAALGIMPWMLALAGVLWLFGLALFPGQVSWPKETKALQGWPKMQSHRGRSPKTSAPDNSVEAVVQARAAGHDMVEVDVQPTSDGQIILWHDRDITMGDGSPRRVSNLTWAEIHKHYPNVSLLKDLIRAQNRPAFLNIELKVYDRSKRKAFVKSLSWLFHELGVKDQILISSFDAKTLRLMSEWAPHIPRALLIGSDIKMSPRWWIGLAQWYTRSHLWHLDSHLLTKSWLSALQRKEDIYIATWTVNDGVRATELREQGVFSIISDRLV